MSLPLLMLIVMKSTGELKTRGVTNSSYQWTFSENNENSLPVTDFCTFKHACGMIAKEKRDPAIVGLPGFFLQTECKHEELILLKLTGTVALLLV